MPALLPLLQEIAEFLEGQSDVVDGSYGEQEPNRAMSLLTEVEQAIERVKSSGQDLPLRTILHRWSKASHIQLCAGEMSAGELRAVKAVVAAISRECFPEDCSIATAQQPFNSERGN